MAEIDAKMVGQILIGIAVLCLVVVSLTGFSAVFLSSFSSQVQSLNETTGTSTEQFNGTGGTAYTFLHPPKVEVKYFYLSTAASVYNDTLSSGNASTAAATKILTLTTPLDNGSTSGGVWTLRVAAANTTGANVTFNGAYQGEVMTGIKNFTIAVANRATPATVVISFLGANLTNITNVTLDYYKYATNTNYTNVTTTTLTPTVSGSFRTTYTYVSENGLDTTAATEAADQGILAIVAIPGWLPIIILAFILVVILLLLAAVILVAARLQGGGKQ